MNKLLIIILLSICIFPLNFSLNASPSAEAIVSCSPHLQKYFQAILKIPEARTLIDSVRKEGSFHIVTKNTALSKQFGAFWDPDRRVIYVDYPSSRPEGFLIGSLIFELHNASVNSKFNHLNALANQGKIDKEKYVESMEYLEYLNSLNASKITQKGIKMGIFPKEAYLPTYPNFQEHYRAQQMSGHSACFARNFEVCSR